MKNNALRRGASAALWALCRLLPVQENKVVFCSAGGRGFGDNPKAVALDLLERAPHLDLVWLCRDVSTPLPQGIRPVRYGSAAAVKELSTAKVWVNDSRGGAKYKKKVQKYLQTWHGFPLKHIEKSAKNLPQSYVEQCKKDAAMTDLMVAGSGFLGKVYKEDFWYDGEIGLYGSPRNDVFFQDNCAVAEKVRRHFSLAPDRKILLYAPTFRDDGRMDCYNLDTHAVLDALKQRFGSQWSILCRLHPNIADQSADLFPYDATCVLDASRYPDMQELLLACDMLITDYSSSMFDFALSGKPCFRFATDLERYTKDRGFYFQMDEIPFPLAQSEEELLDILKDFDENKQKERWECFAAEQGFCEDGKASERCANWILEKTQGASL